METNSDADFEEEEDEEPEFSGKQVLPVLFKPWNDHLEKLNLNRMAVIRVAAVRNLRLVRRW